MKKLLTSLGLILLLTTSVNAAEKIPQPPCGKQLPPKMTQQQRIQREAAFDKKLNLTEEQKVQARELRKEGFTKIKPVVNELKLKEQEAKILEEVETRTQVQEEKLNTVNNEIKNLRKKIHEIKKENMKDFEAILTPEQKKTLKEMKKEGRKNFNKKHSHVMKKVKHEK